MWYQVLFCMTPVLLGIVAFFIWAYRLDQKCENGGRCTGDVYDFKTGKYKDSGMTFHYTHSYKLHCKKCGKIYERS